MQNEELLSSQRSGLNHTITKAQQLEFIQNMCDKTENIIKQAQEEAIKDGLVKRLYRNPKQSDSQLSDKMTRGPQGHSSMNSINNLIMENKEENNY